jgi:hypothetical protein
VPFDSSIFQSRVLGKRGRLYDEVWDEADYLEKKAALIEKCNSSAHLVPFRTEVVDNWSQILNHYSDDHDGVYVDWRLDRAHEKCKQKKMNEIYTLKREEERIKSQLHSEEEVMCLCPPPVPVSCQHPASWGLHQRRRGGAPPPAVRDPSMGLDACRKKRSRGGVSSSSSSSSSSSGSSSSGEGGEEGGEKESGDSDGCGINPAHWHPAAHTSGTVLPVAYSSSSSSRHKAKHHRANTSKSAASVLTDDVDDLSVHLDSLVNQLAVQSASNFVTLSNLTSAVGIEINLQSLRSQHRTLENASLQISDFFRKTEEELLNATAEASLQQQQQQQQESARQAMIASRTTEAETDTPALKKKKNKNKKRHSSSSSSLTASCVEAPTPCPQATTDVSLNRYN